MQYLRLRYFISLLFFGLDNPNRCQRFFEFRCESKGKGGKPEEYGPCIPMDWVCDNSIDCTDGSDEITKYCNTFNKSEDEFQCHNKHIISKVLTCDKMDNCGDGSDEKDCGGSGW